MISKWLWILITMLGLILVFVNYLAIAGWLVTKTHTEWWPWTAVAW